MKHVLVSEIKSAVWNPKLMVGAILTYFVFLAVGSPYYHQILEMGGGEAGPPWFSLFRYVLFAENSLLIIPLTAPFAYGDAAEEELHSRFALFSYYRSGRREYLFGKAAASFVSGGITVFLGMTALLVTYGCLLHGQPAPENAGFGFIFVTLVLDILRLFLNGGLWAITGALAAVLSKNRYMACAVPFILYYVLSVFQERYYGSLYALSPRYWATPLFFGNGGCMAILVLLLAVCGFLYMAVMKRRLEHV